MKESIFGTVILNVNNRTGLIYPKSVKMTIKRFLTFDNSLKSVFCPTRYSHYVLTTYLGEPQPATKFPPQPATQFAPLQFVFLWRDAVPLSGFRAINPPCSCPI